MRKRDKKAGERKREQKLKRERKCERAIARDIQDVTGKRHRVVVCPERK